MLLRSTTVPIIRAAALRQSTFLPKNAALNVFSLTTKRQRYLNASTAIVMNIKVGEKMEDYPEYFDKVSASDGSSISLSSFKGQQPVVLFFYPRAGTPGCTKQAQTFRDEYDKLKGLGAAVFGISGDALDAQKSFANAENLPFPLLVDKDNKLRKGFGIPADLFGALPGRQTIVIDREGSCILSYNNQMQPESHASEAIKALS